MSLHSGLTSTKGHQEMRGSYKTVFLRYYRHLKYAFRSGNFKSATHTRHPTLQEYAVISSARMINLLVNRQLSYMLEIICAIVKNEEDRQHWAICCSPMYWSCRGAHCFIVLSFYPANGKASLNELDCQSVEWLPPPRPGCSLKCSPGSNPLCKFAPKLKDFFLCPFLTLLLSFAIAHPL